MPILHKQVGIGAFCVYSTAGNSRVKAGQGRAEPRCVHACGGGWRAGVFVVRQGEAITEALNATGGGYLAVQVSHAALREEGGCHGGGRHPWSMAPGGRRHPLFKAAHVMF